MKILVVSLPGDVARRRIISDRLAELGLSFDFVDAIDGRQGIPERYNDLVDRKALATYVRQLTDGEIACSLTHALACRNIAQQIREPAIVLEDDAVLPDDFATLANSGLLEKSGDELVLLYHNNTRAMKWPRKRLFAEYCLRRPLKAPWGAVGYYVSPEGAKMIAKQSLPVHGVADWGFDIMEMRISCIVPRIVEHPPIDPAQTTMTERNFDDAAFKARRRGLWDKTRDPKYRRYFLRKLISEWVYHPER